MAVAVHVWFRPPRTTFRIGCDNVISATHSSAPVSISKYASRRPSLNSVAQPCRSWGMTIIVFLIDTSASMCQRTYMGGRPTLLDIAKGAVESFVKVCTSAPRASLFLSVHLLSLHMNSHSSTRWTDSTGCFIYIFFLLYRLDRDLQRAEVIDTCC